ncbi:hypothetical protein M8J75_002259 [Diaphorina citri]|nr:hypothetical protein M8J75_002259 [Diaphorina citri]
MDQNLLLCESFIKCLKQKNSEVNKEKFWHFLTNVSCTLKSKYYMMGVCFLSDFYYDDVLDSWLIDNMVYSLSRSYLVTAGAWCHKVLVKNVLTEEKWKNTFLEKVIDLVCYSDICIRQNVCNYWLPTAIKYYPNIIQLLYDRVIEKYNVIQKHCWVTKEMYCKNRNIDELQRYLHSVILIVKLERPAKFNTITYNCVQEALKCSDELIRGDAFLCCQTFNGVKSHVPMQGMSAESCQVFQDIFQFLEENINCDDANLRQTIYKVFKNYVRNTEGQFHKCAVPIDLVVRTKGTSEPFKLPEFMDNYVKQYSRLYTFFIGNLADGSNYQRLITTLNLLNILLENMQPHMTENQKKKRKPTIDYLREIGKWNFESSECRERLFNCLKDDTNDVRSMAKHVLQCYFNYTKEEVSLFLTNLQSSLRMSQSNVFYTAESGAYAVAVLVNLFYKAQYDRMELRNSLSQVLNCSMDSDELDALCKAVTELGLNSNLDKSLEHNLFSTYFLNQCLVQSEFLQKDILLAVKNRNSLHGSLTTLMLLLTDPTSPEFCGLDPNQVQSLLNLLNETCLYLLDILCMKSRSTNFAPSFGEMGEAMNSLINVTDDTEQLTLTPAHQTLFNCIWMNLKICCTFASELAVAYRNKLSRDQIVFSCGIVSHVLHKCRHKGAIQNAGLALANIVSKCLYQDPYPLELLQYTLKSVLECTVGGTVSRKSAGVAILVHKLLASNHSMKEKLFTTAMEKILEVANSPVLPSEETLKVDLPQAIAFHMLQFLVADSGLRVTMAAYLEQITMVCFEKMNCKEWTVRNAALQVFGVLLPKLVGTKKQDSENQSSNVAFEEFFYQLPDIGNCLKSVLSSVNDTNTSVLVSALTLLSRLKTTGDLFHVKQDYMALKEFLSDIFPALLSNNIDYNYIVHLIHTLRQESDALNDVLLYLSHLLKDFSTKTKLEMSEEYSNNEQNAKSRNRNQQAQSCIKAILKIACTLQKKEPLK